MNATVTSAGDRGRSWFKEGLAFVAPGEGLEGVTTTSNTRDPFDALLDRLTEAKKRAIRAAFRQARRPPREAQTLIADWVRIAETAHQYALKTDLHARVLLSPAARKRRDRQLRRGTDQLSRAMSASTNAFDLLERFPVGFSSEQLGILRQARTEVWTILVRTRGDAERHRRSAATLPANRNRSGNTLRWIPERCLGEVLAAYFRHRGWPVEIRPRRTALFRAVAGTALHRTAMNDQTLRSLQSSSLDYATLEAAAPQDVKPAYPARVPHHRSHRLTAP